MNLPKINLDDAPWEKCECGNIAFSELVVYKRISSLLSPSGKEEIFPIQIVKCDICGKIPPFIIKKVEAALKIKFPENGIIEE